jgi:hypothetical protein
MKMPPPRLTYLTVMIEQVRTMIKSGLVTNSPDAAFQWDLDFVQPPHGEPCGHCGVRVEIPYDDYPNHINYSGGATISCPLCGGTSEFAVKKQDEWEANNPIWELKPLLRPDGP